ncbi:ADIPOR-like receptor Izh2p [[Candida] jaroonii]|uniref:ADIPOR-like receptor Izh2p n=1 Tax=[Candida] jaroonii TaxID=467808 RepID=A0ACA9YA77_9ASCO|nr:ADIPOR-like receptor Izh2p [[Candida] jaroonii]
MSVRQRKTTDTTSKTSTSTSSTSEKVKDFTKTMKLSFYHELDEWQQDNHFIKSGYVRGTNSYKESFLSLFYIHNETGNIYSHLLPSLVIIASILYYINYQLEDVKLWEQLNFLQFGLASTFCLLMSSIFHCLKSHSHKVSKFGNRLDYFGIIILITCSLISIIMFAFVNEPGIRNTLMLVFLSLGGLCTFFTLDVKFSSPKYRPIRSTMFILFGLSGVLPILVSTREFGWENTKERSSINYLILEGVFYIFGAVLYAMRVPERFTHIEDDALLGQTVGKFDIWGHSHQIFHVFVVIAAFCHWKALVNVYIYMRQH